MITGLNNNIGTTYTAHSNTNSAQNQNIKAQNKLYEKTKNTVNTINQLSSSLNNLKSDSGAQRLAEIGKIIASFMAT